MDKTMESKIDKSAKLISDVMIENIPPCILCGETPKVLLNIITPNRGMSGFSVCKKCMAEPLQQILAAVAFSTMPTQAGEN